MSRHAETLVIGAGPAGLTAAYVLSKEGRSVAVLERDPVYVGGISRTVDYKGFLVDIGGHRFFSKSREIVDLWDEILPHDFLDRPRLSRIYYGGKFYSYPLKAFEALSNLGIFRSAACVASYLYASAPPRRRPAHPPRVGPEPFRREALLDLLQDLHGEGLGDVVRRDLRRLGGAAHQGPRPGRRDPRRHRPRALAGEARRAGGATIKTLIESFRYPRRGPGMMWNAAAGRSGPTAAAWSSARASSVCRGTRAKREWSVTRAARRRRDRELDGRERRVLRGALRSCPRAPACADHAPSRALAPLSRLPHRRADRQGRGKRSPTTGSTSTIRR